MRDDVTLRVNGHELGRFLTYRVDANLFMAADAFELTMAMPKIQVSPGDRCDLVVNGAVEMTGVLDAVNPSYDNSGSKMRATGRDLMGLLADSYVEDFPDLANISLKTLAETLLADVPHINRKSILYGKGNKNRAVPLSEKEEDFEFAQIEPARTVFDVLREFAMSQGKLFFSLPDGTLVFGQPRTGGTPDFTLVNRKNGRANNILEGSKTNDISRRYSKVTVHGQQQGTDMFGADEINFTGTVTDDDFPGGLYKPFVAVADTNGQAPEKYARILMDKQRFEGFSLRYKVPGHSQGGRNWTINAVCRVEDEVLGESGDYLIYERSFVLSKRGSFTELALSKLGVLPA